MTKRVSHRVAPGAGIITVNDSGNDYWLPGEATLDAVKTLLGIPLESKLRIVRKLPAGAKTYRVLDSQRHFTVTPKGGRYAA